MAYLFVKVILLQQKKGKVKGPRNLPITLIRFFADIKLDEENNTKLMVNANNVSGKKYLFIFIIINVLLF